MEAAFALPIFFLMVLGLIDFGIVGLNDNQAGNAARDGARVGIIDYRQADVVGTAAYEAIASAIEANLPGRNIPGDTSLQVSCIQPNGDPVSGGCASARVDIDRIRVEVSWTQPFLSPVASALGFDSVVVDGDSSMVIVGRPVAGGGVPPDPCDVSAVSVSPNPVIREASGVLATDLTVTVAATGACGNLTVNLVQGALTETVCTGPACTGALTFPADQTNAWSTGPASVVVSGDDLASAGFLVIALDPCVVTGVTMTPGSATRHVSGERQDELTSNLSFSVTRTGTCAELTVTMTAPGSGVERVLCAAAPCSSAGYIAFDDKIWPAAGDGLIEVSGDDSFSATFEVVDAPAVCAVDVSVNTTSARADSNRQDLESPTSLTVTVTPSGPCSNFTVDLVASNGSTVFPICSGACSGTLSSYDPPRDNTRPWLVGNARVRVTGDAEDFVTFSVT